MTWVWIATIILGVASGVVSNAIYNVIEMRVGKPRKALSGTWHSTWQTNSGSNPNWCKELVTIKPALWPLRQLRFTSDKNDLNYHYTAWGYVHWNGYIAGSWQSNVNADSHGTFILSLSNQAEFLVGFFLGTSQRASQKNYGVWVMAKNDAGLEAAKAEFRILSPTIAEVLK